MSHDSSLHSLFGPVIFSYSRREAIEDGVLYDVTEQAREAGFEHDFALTASVWADLHEGMSKGETVGDRLQEVLYLVRLQVQIAIAEGRGEAPQLMIFAQVGLLVVRYKLHIGPGDTMEPVWTLLKPDED